MASHEEQHINNISDEVDALELRRARARQNYYDNREVMNERAKAYYHANKEKIKLREEANAEKKKAYWKEYYIKNRKALIAKRSLYQKNRNNNGESYNTETVVEKTLYVVCNCGARVKRYGMIAHCKTHKHISAMANDGVVTRHNIQCECGCIVSKKSIYSHRKTQKHQKCMESKKE